MKKRSITLLLFLHFIFFSGDIFAQGWLWAAKSSAGFDAWAIATDPLGNVFVGGETFLQQDTYFGTYLLPNTLNLEQAVIAKYDISGNFLWVIGAEYSDSWVTNITTDNQGNVYVLGAFSTPTLQMNNVTLVNNTGPNIQAFLMKIGSGGNIIWAKDIGGGTYEFSVAGSAPTVAWIMSTGALATDAAGNVYVAADYKLVNETIDNVTLQNSDPLGNSHDVALLKIDPGGTLIWAKNFGGSGDDYAFGLTVTPAGSIYISGIFNSPSIALGNTTITNVPLAGPLMWTAYIARFDANGNPVWGTCSGGNGHEFATGIKSDANNNVYVTGGFKEDIHLAGVTIPHPFDTGKYSLFLAKIDESNNLSWYKTIGNSQQGGGDTWGYSISASPCGYVWVEGDLVHQVNIDGNLYSAASGLDPVFIAGYTEAGTFSTAMMLASGADDETDITTDNMGNLYIAGDSNTPFAIANTNLSDGECMYIAKYATVQMTPDTITERTDTALCSLFSPYILHAPSGSVFYHWSNGSADSLDTISGAGTYWVMAYGNCAQNVVIDTFHVSITTPDTALNIKDTTVCSTTAVLKAPGGYISYLWNDGTTADTDIVSTTGTYFLVAKKDCHVLLYTYRIIMAPPGDTLSGHTDTTICNRENHISLNVPPNYDNYIWSTGSTTNTIDVNNTGTYWVVASGITCNKPVLRDTFYVQKGPDLTFSLGNDTLVCNPYTLSVPLQNKSYLWQDGSNENSYTVVQTGIYQVTVFDSGCIYKDTILVTLPDLKQNLHDTLLCREDGLNLYLSANVPPGAHALWSNGSTDSLIYISDTGVYHVLVKEGICSDSAYFTVGEIKCDCWADVPSAFTPNNDSKNDYFFPLLEPDCDIHDYKFAIYNRYGQVVFKTTDPKSSWDGKFNGVNCDMDTYMYLLEYKAGTKQTRHLKKGDVTLIR